jgi:hypothetical protein
MEQLVNDMEEMYGKLLLGELFTSVWFGHWDHYEAMMSGVPEELAANLPFHSHYSREDTALWRDNYFQIPGPYFVPLIIPVTSTKVRRDRNRHAGKCYA